MAVGEGGDMTLVATEVVILDNGEEGVQCTYSDGSFSYFQL